MRLYGVLPSLRPSGSQEFAIEAVVETRERSALVASQARVFSVLWALAHLGHLLRKADRTDPLVWVVMIAAVLVLERPSSARRVAALACVQIPYLYLNLPATDNHLVIMGFANLGIIIAAGRGRMRARGGAENGAEPSPPLSDAFPFLRLSIVLAYGAAAVAKLNAGFFDVEVSCAVQLTDDALAIFGERAPPIPDAAVAYLPHAVAGIELAIPLLLLVPATRTVGVATVVLFHLAMSLSPTATAGDFTVVLFGLAFLFLPVEAGAWVESVWSRARGSVTRYGRVSPSAWLVIGTGVIGGMIGGRGLEYFTVASNRNWVWLAFMGIVLGALLLAACCVAWMNRWQARSSLLPTSWFYAPVILLLVSTAAAPYVGSKTVAVFTMYSNLQTEGGETNHFILPRLPREGSQDDLVEVLDSSNSRLRRIGDRGHLISFHELRRELAGDPEASISFVRDGQLFEYDMARVDPVLVTTDWPAHRLIQHRVFSPDRASCRW